MRAALLVLTLAAASLLGSLNAWSKFDCFETPGEGRRCACIGTGNCSEMKSSDSCKSDPQCDKSELGAIICSCKAVRTSRSGL
jgi:hypothetical protein